MSSVVVVVVVGRGMIIPFQHGIRLKQIKMIADAIPYPLRAGGTAQSGNDARDAREYHEDVESIHESHVVEGAARNK